MRYILAAVQMPTATQLSANLPKILHYIRRAAEDHADFVLFPEGALSGYQPRFDQAHVEAGLEQIAAACDQNNICALVGTCFRDRKQTYNQVRIYGPDGDLIGVHCKTLLTNGDLRWSTPGGELHTFKHNGLHFGVLICNDMWATPPCSMPDTHLAQQIASRDAQMIFHAINSGPSGHYLKWHEAHQEMFARIYGLHILAANATRPAPLNSPTGLLAPDGKWIARAHRFGEQYLLGDLSI